MQRLVFALAILAGLAGASVPAGQAATPIELTWRDLIPKTAESVLEDMVTQFGIIQHGEATPRSTSAAVVTTYNDKLVSLPGFVIPMGFDGDGMTEFMLVPFVGACIHVPPPPPNQLVFVTAEEPLPLIDLFAPVRVVGEIATATTRTELADVGYVMKAMSMQPYEE